MPGLTDMEIAALDARVRPVLLHCGDEGVVAVDDRNHRGWDTCQQCCPGCGFLAVAPLPVDDMSSGVGDEDAPAVEVGAIEHDLVVDLAVARWNWLDVPAPLGAAGECASAGGEVAALLRTGQPCDVSGEVGLSRRVEPGLGG